jgi:hypothetical protein
LDSGLPDKLVLDPDNRLALISHDHSDHTGGLKAIRGGGLRLARSVETGGCLVATGRQSDGDIRERTLLFAAAASRDFSTAARNESPCKKPLTSGRGSLCLGLVL